MKFSLKYLWVINKEVTMWAINSAGEKFFLIGKNPMFEFFVGVDEKGNPTQHRADHSDWRPLYE